MTYRVIVPYSELMKLASPSNLELRVADEVWISVALLHREHPERDSFAEHEIMQRALAENLTGALRPGFRTHVSYHCVAIKPPNPSGYRMLHEVGTGIRRLYREGDPTHPARKGKITPEPENIPAKYHHLLDWYRKEYAGPPQDDWLGGIFDMIGAGKEDFAGVDADAYVRELREGWD